MRPDGQSMVHWPEAETSIQQATSSHLHATQLNNQCVKIVKDS